MTIHIWCPRPSDSAIQLRDAIRAAGVTCHKTKPNPNLRNVEHFAARMRQNDLFVNWGNGPTGERFLVARDRIFDPVSRGVRILNDNESTGKNEQLLTLYRTGVVCPEVFDSPGEGRIGRSMRHSGGRDLLRGNGRDYYVQRLQLDREFRIHVFRGKSIRAGVKVPRDGFCYACSSNGGFHDGTHYVHPWIRSYDAGWRISYSHDHRLITDRIRDIAKRAVSTLGLDFGAVDVGMCNGQPVVLEVNLAPGLEGGSVGAYVRHILEVYRS